MQTLWYLNSQSDNQTYYQVTNGWGVSTAYICWTKWWFIFWAGWNRTVWDFIRLLRRACNLKYDLFISGIFYLIFLDHSWSQVMETTESKTTDKEGLLYTQCTCVVEELKQMVNLLSEITKNTTLGEQSWVYWLTAMRNITGEASWGSQ